MSAAVDRLVAALPDIDVVLNPPAAEAQLQDGQSELGYLLPTDVVELNLQHDGQPPAGPGLFGGLPFLPLADALAEWRAWRSLAADHATETESLSEPSGAVREAYLNPGWFPLSVDGGGNNLGVDCDPGPAGTRGPLINFGRDEEVKYAYAPSLTAFLTPPRRDGKDGRAVVERDGEQVYWGIDDAQRQWPRYRDFTLEQRDEVTDSTWYADLEPAWQERIGGLERLLDFLTALKFASFARDKTLARVSSLEPLGRATNLREVIIHTRVLDALTDLPVLPQLTKLIVSTCSHAGIERFPALAEYLVGKRAPAADLTPGGRRRRRRGTNASGGVPDLPVASGSDQRCRGRRRDHAARLLRRLRSLRRAEGPTPRPALHLDGRRDDRRAARPVVGLARPAWRPGLLSQGRPDSASSWFSADASHLGPSPHRRRERGGPALDSRTTRVGGNTTWGRAGRRPESAVTSISAAVRPIS